MKDQLLRFDGALERDPVIDAWLNHHPGDLGAIARHWFQVMPGAPHLALRCGPDPSSASESDESEEARLQPCRKQAARSAFFTAVGRSGGRRRNDRDARCATTA